MRNNNTSPVIVNFLLGPGEYNAEHIPFMGITVWFWISLIAIQSVAKYRRQCAQTQRRVSRPTKFCTRRDVSNFNYHTMGRRLPDEVVSQIKLRLDLNEKILYIARALKVSRDVIYKI